MKISISKELNFPLECCILLECKATKDRDIHPELHDLLMKNGATDALKNWVSTIHDTMEYVWSHLDIDPQKLQFYFNCDSTPVSSATALTIWQGGSLSRLAEFLLPDGMEPAEINTPAQFMSALEQVDISPQARWNKMQIFCDAEKYLAELKDILAPAVKLFEQKAASFYPLLEQWHAQLEKAVLPDSRTDFFAKIHVTPEQEDEIILSPFIIIPNGVIFFGTNFDGAPIRINYGVLFDELFELDKQFSDNSEVLSSLLQVIADKRRLEILCALKTSKLCGQDLAKLLSLTPATISHHMNSLMQCGLIDIEKQGTKLIYSLSKRSIEALIERIRGTLL